MSILLATGGGRMAGKLEGFCSLWPHPGTGSMSPRKARLGHAAQGGSARTTDSGRFPTPEFTLAAWPPSAAWSLMGAPAPLSP